MQIVLDAAFDRIESALPPCVGREESAGLSFASSDEPADRYVWGVVECAAATVSLTKGGYVSDWAVVIGRQVRRFIEHRLAGGTAKAKVFALDTAREIRRVL